MAIAIRVEHFAIRVEAIAIGVEAIASRLEAIAIRIMHVAGSQNFLRRPTKGHLYQLLLSSPVAVIQS